MSNAKQILAMLRSRAEGDEDAFFSIALQVAASEARQGLGEKPRRKCARKSTRRGRRIRTARRCRSHSLIRAATLRVCWNCAKPRYKLKDVVLNSHRLLARFSDILRQQRKRDWLREHGKTPSRRILFVGSPAGKDDVGRGAGG